MKKIVLSILVFLSSMIYAENILTVYTSRHYDTDKLLYEAFEKKTGIKVNVVQNKEGKELIKRLELEGKDTQADVFMVVGMGDIHLAKTKDLLQKTVTEKIKNNVENNFLDKDSMWTAITYRARIFVYNPEKVSEKELSTYEDLANVKWNKRILTRSSTSAYNNNLISFMITKNGEKEATKWAKALVENFARDPKGNDRDQAKAVVAGIADVAIINSYYMGKMSVSKDPLEQETASKLKVFFPNQNDGGTHINISAAAITKYAKNKENAIKFIEFLTEAESQKILAEKNFEYPVNKKAQLHPLVKSWGTFKASKLDFGKISENIDKVKKVADEANWK